MEDQVLFSLRQFTEAWRVFCQASPTHETRQRNGAEYIFSGLPIPFFNIVAITERIVSPEALRGHACAACEWASTKSVPWFFVVTHDALTDNSVTAEVLDDSGLAPMVPLTGMRAAQVASLTSLPDGLELIQPDDDGGCAALVTVNGAAYGVPLDTCIEAIGSHRLWKDHVAVVGKVDGKPVTCSAVVLVDGYRYVAFVATDPGHQRRGYAEAAMRRALDLAARAYGEVPTVLHSTNAGRPVYERMGYAPISAHTMYIEKRFLDQQ